MMKRWKKAMVLLLSMAMLLSLFPAAQAESTTLTVDFRGMTAAAGGQWLTQPLNGSFTVERDGEMLGVVSAGGDALAIPGSGNVTLKPMMADMPQGYLISESGVSVSIQEGRSNAAPVLVYADAGLFTVEADGAASFELLDAKGQAVLTFDSDSQGVYALPEAIASGSYTLRQTKAVSGKLPAEDVTFDLPAYRGVAEQIVNIVMHSVAVEATVTAQTTPAVTEAAAPNAPVTAALRVTEEAPLQADITIDCVDWAAWSDASKLVLLLPQGWKLAAGDNAYRTADGDMLVLPPLTSESTVMSAPLSQTGASANAKLYVKTDADANGEANRLVDAMLGVTGGSYVVYDVSAHADTVVADEYALQGRIVSGLLADDVNYDGVISADEKGTANRIVTLTGDGITHVTGTDESGSFSFADVPEMPMTLGVTLQDGMTLLDGTDLSVAATGDVNTVIGYAVLSRVSGRVTDEQGHGLQGVHVTLNSMTQLTDEAGQYAFAELAPGAYTLSFNAEGLSVALPNDKQTQQVNVGSAGGKDVTVDVMTQSLGSLRLEMLEQAADAGCTLLSAGSTVAQCQTENGAAAFPSLQAGEYTLVVTLPDNVVMTALNGYATVQKGQMQWQVSVANGTESLYQMTLSAAGAISGTVMGLQDGTEVSMRSSSDAATAIVSGGAYSAASLCPGEYTVSLPLDTDSPMSGENWEISDNSGSRIAATTVTVTGGTVSAVPVLATVKESSVSGQVIRAEDGAGMAGLSIALLDESGAVIASAATDDAGAWMISGLHGGTYILQVNVDDTMALSGKSDTTVVGVNGQSDAFILLDGQDLTGMNAAVVKPAAIVANVFIDANNNGERGTYERMLSGVSLMAVRVSADGETVVTAASTGEDGYAALSQLPPGDYKLRVTMPEGYAFTKQGKETRATSSIMAEGYDLTQDSAVFTLNAGEELSVGVGAMLTSAVKGLAWLDSNADGIKTDDEPMQSGVLVELIGTKNGLTYQTTTGEDGTYMIGQVKPGSYKLRFTTPDGLMFTKYSATGRENRSIITTEGKRTGAKDIDLDDGDVLDKQYVGLVPEATIEGICFLDANYNGLLDQGEAALPGVEVELIKANGKTVSSATSGEDGRFTIVALRANTYRLRVVLPDTGVTFTKVVDDPSVVSNLLKARPGRRENSIDGMTITTGEHHQVVVGAVLPGSISGTAYLDNNFSATKDSGEKAVSGMTITLTDAAGNVIDTAKTSAKGKFTFDGLNPGEYRLTTTAKTGYAFTKLGEGNVMLNQGSGSGATEVFMLALGEERIGMDCGMILPGTVQGVFFADLNDNGLRDEGENGLVGTVVRLMSDEGEHFSAAMDESGAFCFDAVMPGRYYLRYELPENAIFAQVTEGGNAITGTDGTGAGSWFDFATGDTVNAPLAGGLTLGAIDGTAFHDQDGSGVSDGADAALSGVTITLTPDRSELEPLTSITDANGHFALTELHPGSYQLTATFPEGMVMSRAVGTTLPITPGENGISSTLTIAMGASWHDQQLGGVTPSSLMGQLWLDENNDGRLDSGEATPAGETITVIDQYSGSVFAALTTDENGVFSTEGMIPGSYTLRYALQGETIAPVGGDSTFTEENGALMMRDVTLQEGETRNGLVLGIVRYTTLGGTVWLDQGGSIVPLTEASVSLMDEGGTKLQAFTTGEDGTYRFTKLLPGSYYITVTLPEGQLVVDAMDERITSGRQISIMTQSSGRTGQSSLITVRMGEDQSNMDIGSVLPGRLGDLCWLDENGNGLQDYGDGGIPGVKIELMKDGQAIAETTSDQYGYWVLDNVYPAAYTLRVTPPAEVKATRQNTAFPSIASVLEEGDGDTFLSVEVTVVSDKHNYDADLGFVLRTAGVYPAGYGMGAKQDWTKLVIGE